MKKLLSFTVAIMALSAGAARAADVMSDPAYDWSGFYSGVHFGYAQVDGTYFADTVGNEDLDVNGARFGTLGGYNFQSDNIVFGIESATSFGNLSDSTPTIDKFKIGIESTLRARVGVGMDRFLPFISGGAALVKATSNDFGTGKDSNYHLGFVVGGGLEYAVNDNIRIRGEYLYENFGKKTYHIGRFNDTAKWDQHIVRAAVIWAW
jgi:outer membrane immunogenic protein